MGEGCHAGALSRERRMNRTIVDTLNTLIKACVEGGVGYVTEASRVADPNRAMLLRALADRHYTLASQLQAVVLQLGGEPAEESTHVDPWHDSWHRLHATLLAVDLPAPAESIERQALASYENALTESGMPPAVRSLLARHYTRIKGALDMIRHQEN